MRKSALLYFSILLILASTLFQSCKDDGNLTAAPAMSNQSFVENFDTAAAALSRGWVFKNTSDPKGGGVWQDGGEVAPWFRSWSNYGNKAGFIGTDYTSTSAASGTISNWLISPPVILQNGDKISFYTRSLIYFDPTLNDSTDYGNRLRVCINQQDDQVNVGTGADMGTFKSLYDVNSALLPSSSLHPVVNAYPSQWTRFEVTVSGLTNPTKARFGFQYFVENGGSNGNGSGVAIDQVTFTSISK